VGTSKRAVGAVPAKRRRRAVEEGWHIVEETFAAGHQWRMRRGRAAAIYSLIGTAKLNSLDPEAYLRNELSRIAGHPFNHRGEALPWNVTTNPAEQSFHLAQLPKLFFSMARHGGRIHLLRSVQPKCF
jgi:hypothetical protein